MTAVEWRGPRLIGFAGRAGAGKTTAARYLCERYGFTRVRFAGPLKDMMRALGLTDAEVEGDRKEAPCDLLCGRTPRQAMQWLGTEWGRDLLGPDFWVEAWSRQAQGVLVAGGRVAIDDVRFLNEASKIWGFGGIVVKIVAEGAAPPPASHRSEEQGFPYDLTIENPHDGLLALHHGINMLNCSAAFGDAVRRRYWRQHLGDHAAGVDAPLSHAEACGDPGDTKSR
ncbi:hypothetical protein [Methylocella tundrae]|uniref:Deoxynucleotide monophosphate kinase (Modular protein) n=1 Tax=Methylocella tundrae TaxID=227605 RepID=A0A4U8YX11_METTU|nr:hypothetical protein [Methylocella tundrae]WPP05536.1 hypothetical protein SIN04_06845 [Methylocella tundrae]VFU07965.1 Deoxynucleotide monophosphate kinase (modular protein) [Methylocella tundrae]